MRGYGLKEVFEVSNRDSDEIPYIANGNNHYPIELKTTKKNLKGEDIQRGTLVITLMFGFEVEEIEEMRVWVVNENGHTALDRFRFDGKDPGGRASEHINHNPFKNGRYELAIPIHVVTRKENRLQFDMKFKPREGIYSSNETVVIPFEANFESEGEYANIADHIGMFSTTHTRGEMEVVQFGSIRLDLVEEVPILSSTEMVRVDMEHESLRSVTYSWIDSVHWVVEGGITRFETEFVDLRSISIGGRI